MALEITEAKFSFWFFKHCSGSVRAPLKVQLPATIKLVYDLMNVKSKIITAVTVEILILIPTNITHSLLNSSPCHEVTDKCPAHF